MKILSEKIKIGEEIEVCDFCFTEVEWKKNDWDSYQECPQCGKHNFTGNLKTIKAKRQYIERIVI